MRPPPLGLGLVAALLLAFAGPAAAAAAPVPVHVCEENRDWRRPSPAEMAATVWRDNRYRDPATGAVNDRTLAYYTHHFLFFTIVSASGTSHALNMTGLTTARPRGLCTPPYDEALGRGQASYPRLLGRCRRRERAVDDGRRRHRRPISGGTP